MKSVIWLQLHTTEERETDETEQPEEEREFLA